ncbi:tyrosine--tRNA ligase [Ornithinimicrobium sp. W1679]|uniref:tyrosine--tRNA ligase n=1 Tax=Ornithinimicrobium sp. W1679 TaxID=3418770 RepID=UPI003CF1B5C2
MTNILDELQWRGLVAQSTDEDSLREALADTLTVYCGFDPTAPSLHFGNLVQLIVLRHLQRAGHRVLCLVGGSTGLIGDPRPTSERVLKTKETTAQYVERIREQVQPFLDFEGANPAVVVNNLDWTAPLSALDFLRDVGKHFRVNQMIRKEAIAARLESQEGISYTEFSYQLLQALDFLHLYREHGCTLQTGGQDQWGNLTAGVDLIHRAEGATAHVMTTPLVTDENGEKYGKSAGNAVWLAADMTSPYAFYQYWINVADSQVGKLLRVFTDRDESGIADLESAAAERPHLREAQRALAADVTTLVHGAAATAQVEAASQVLFGRGEPSALDPDTVRDATAELPGAEVPVGSSVVEALVLTGLADSRGAARRLVAEGGVSLNNAKVADAERLLSETDFLHGQVALLRRGRKSLAAARRTVGAGSGQGGATAEELTSATDGTPTPPTGR